MSLKIWLPMNRDLRNQGLLNNTITNSGATYSSDGKLGGCYIFDGVDDSLAVGNLSTMVETDFSFACWFYKDEWGSKGYETIFGGPSGFELESKVSSTNSPVLKLYNWGGGSCTYELSKWNHIVFTRNSTETKLYLNGELKVTGSAGTIPNNNYFVGSWNSATQQNFKGKMCDVRIYDHCLSSMEVKELAKGLVLHYPLNRQGWGQENLLLNSNDLTLWPIESSGKIELQEDGYFKVSSKASNTTRYGIYYDFTFPEPNTYTFSVDVRDDWLIGVAPASTFAWTTANLSGTRGKKRISYTCVSTEENNKCRIYIAGNGTGGRVTYLKQPKFEKGSIATPWCPNSSDALATTMGLNSTIEYDCSGFCNNSTRTGTFTWTSDTPKYSVSTQFNGTQYVETLDEISTVDSTIAVWVNTTLAANGFILECRNSSGSGKQPIYQYTNGSIQAGGSGKYVTTNTGLLVANTWIHLAIVQDGDSILVYKNGQLFQTISCTNSPIIRPVLGARYTHGGGFTGSLCDLRVYATALSPSDVKSLYQNCATIDPDGTIRGQIRS